jgi:glycerophosphoryl diester phosphodiesterase
MPNSSAWLREAPLVIAHRGASQRAPENTLEAFRLALEEGADAVELDAKLTADGSVIAFHDPTLERTSDGRGRPGELNLAQIRRLDAGSWKGPPFRGARIPTLEEAFAELGRRLLFNIELTNYQTPDDGLVEHVLDVVKAAGMESRVLLSSFYRRNLAEARRRAPEIPLGHLIGPTSLAVVDWWGAVDVPTEAIHPYRRFVSRGLVRRWHAQGRRVIVYTVNEAARMRHLMDIGVDGMITDDPRLARATVGK